ncbi:MAG: aldolase/citrate lyase family protein [Pseudomonadales bacterium]|nr:aldolase/citrate lyase family protein [Pseudomonadales bacterium]
MPNFDSIAKQALEQRDQLLAQRNAASADMPLRFWNQQAHFTTPASGSPEKAITGLKATAKILRRFDISIGELAAFTDADQAILDDLINNEKNHTPLVMVDAEDAVALTEDSSAKARDGAKRVFSNADWGSTLAFFRPSGLGLDTCVGDLLEVLPATAEGRSSEEYPIDGIIWPKPEHPEEIRWVCDLLGQVEHELGLKQNQIKFQFLIESGYALNQLKDLAQAAIPRLTGLIWGIADYSADANLPTIKNDHPVCDWARYQLVNMAGALNVPAIDSMTLNYPTPVHRGADLTEQQQQENKQKILRALKDVYDEANHGINLGMAGKWVGHPAQLLMVMAAYRNAIPQSQIDSDIEEIEAYNQAVAAGAGATMIGEGKKEYMADRATDRHLRARLRRATAWGALSAEKALSLEVITEQEKTELGG